MKSLPLAALLAAALPCLPAAALAGVVWEARYEGGEPGDPPILRTIHIAGPKMRISQGPQAVIVRLDQGLMWTTNREAGVYNEVRFSDLGQMLAAVKARMPSVSPEARASMESFLAGMAPNLEVKFEKTGEEATIAGHPCVRYAISGGNVTTTMCAAKDLKHAPDAVAFYEALGDLVNRTPGLDSLKAQTEAYRRMEGVAVEERSTVKRPTGEDTTVYRLVSYKTADLSADLFELPAGLKREPSSLERMMRMTGVENPPAAPSPTPSPATR